MHILRPVSDLSVPTLFLCMRRAKVSRSPRIYDLDPVWLKPHYERRQIVYQGIVKVFTQHSARIEAAWVYELSRGWLGREKDCREKGVDLDFVGAEALIMVLGVVVFLLIFLLFRVTTEYLFGLFMLLVFKSTLFSLISARFWISLPVHYAGGIFQ